MENFILNLSLNTGFQPIFTVDSYKNYFYRKDT